jgi:hypothetical protein
MSWERRGKNTTYIDNPLHIGHSPNNKVNASNTAGTKQNISAVVSSKPTLPLIPQYFFINYSIIFSI